MHVNITNIGLRRKTRAQETHLSCLCLLMQQGKTCQILQEGMRRVEHFGQKLESFTLIMVQDLRIKMKMNRQTDRQVKRHLDRHSNLDR